ncbi:hypothetical protein BBO99_00008106 [Phytophthora kernoviae]|uniref:CBM1 domain-containing protein n=1 Tax=Phytophthora kernoviae TaxID=325452 RepID=A0A3R7HST1_9STRA|nr:hypothetical protein BBI17_008035 [Phytophthora kernoviae]RLN75744.1 hypothetical protein BBO99_00008106 [Phytophthora kernoviae]
MKLSLATVTVAALAATTAIEGRPHHLRVHILMEKANLYEQCEWENKAVKCNTGMFCVQREKHFGWCLKQSPGEGDQCGGKQTNGPWAVACNNSNLKCVLVSNQYSQCQKKTNREKIKMPEEDKHKAKEGNEEKVALYGRCKYEDGSKSCADGLQCVEDSEWSGNCLKKEADLYEQCGGKEWRGPWKATCTKGAHCKMADEWYSRCMPASSLSKNFQRCPNFSTMKVLPAAIIVTTFAIKIAEAKSNTHLRVMETLSADAGKWEQCKWIDKQIECVDGLQCVVSNDWYGQCIKSEVDTWGQCGGNGWTLPCKAGTVCQKKDDSYSQCVPSPGADKKVGEWGQCSWQGFSAQCDDGLKCVYSDINWFGFCVKKQAGIWAQCGGYGWTTDCVAGSKCDKKSDAYSQCIPSDDGSEKALEWGQCKWSDKQVGCADGLQCAVFDDWYGQCVKKVADVWGQCGGKNWSGACTNGNTCVKRDVSYSQCVPM